MFAEVAVPVYVKQTFTYRLSEKLAGRAQVGCRVIVPFGKKPIGGFIVGLSESIDDQLLETEIKDVEELIDELPVVTPEIMELTRWMADYYFAPWGECLRAALPAAAGLGSESLVAITEAGRAMLATSSNERRMPAIKLQALAAISETSSMNSRDLEKQLAATGANQQRVAAALRQLERAGLIEMYHKVGASKLKPKLQKAVRLINRVDDIDLNKLSEQQKRLVTVLASRDGTAAFSESLQTAEVSASVPRTLEKLGIVEIFARELRRDPLSHLPRTRREPATLTSEQQSALDSIVASIESGNYATVLLHGVTGSGKTEVYIRAILETLKRGKTALMLVPEISLTPMFSRQLVTHFGNAVAILHSSLSDGERIDEWRRIREGTARVVIGTRSAVFAPLDCLGLIVVDEEHEASYKQEESPRYNGRDTAIMRALNAGAVVVLGSATPSLESYHNAHAGKYRYARLQNRFGNRSLAEVQVIDMREVFKRHGKQQSLSEELKAAIEETHARGEQSMILLNRRGYSTYLLCRSCGKAIHCPNCDITLTYHRYDANLQCHYCHHIRPVPSACPECDGPYIYYIGEGTEQMEARLRTLYPTMCVARLDRDTTRRRGSFERTIMEFADGSIDLLVGTQMIAKGHDFPNVTLVGVVSVDIGLAIPDFRSAERVFQLLTQVAGRAGRGERAGRVLIQSYHPEHYALIHAKAQDYEGFYQREIGFRRSMHYPPFTALINLLVHDKDRDRAAAVAAGAAAELRAAVQDTSVRILGPAPAPLARLKGEYRFQILIKATNRKRAREALDIALGRLGGSSAATRSITVEVDPMSLT